ncbi:substrate-binding domain-containing protein [Marinomonas sp. TI.3.20]|uniref:substrate-binding domain-containing protein n=1 Tax=Marinomonas sp. TI.3.20 TaxID=3121296 RepID=UPI00311EE271
MPLYAANVQPFVMDSAHFYALYPGQWSLSEKFAGTVNSPPIPLKIQQRRPIQISILLSDQTKSPKNRSLLSAFNHRMKELKINYRLDVLYGKRNHYDAAEYDKLKQSRPDYLIITDLDLVQSRYIEKMLRDDRTKIIFYGMSTPLTNWQNHSPFMYIGFDQVKAVDSLVSYLHRQLPSTARVAAFVVDSGYLGDRRCNTFLDAMAKENRSIQLVQTMHNDKQSALKYAQVLLKKKSIDFIFSCTQNISDGVVTAIKESSSSMKVQTNSWGLSKDEVANLKSHLVLVSTFFAWDDLAIAAAEAIKKGMEGETAPELYIARASLVSTDIDPESLNLMMQRVFRYSAVVL